MAKLPIPIVAPQRPPDFFIEEDGIGFWWEEKIMTTYDDAYHLNPDDWTVYLKYGEYYDLNPYLLEKYKAEMISSYATWLLEEELRNYVCLST